MRAGRCGSMPKLRQGDGLFSVGKLAVIDEAIEGVF
jgi:hypothetical protein